ncbi:hypothetical protein M8C21_015401 [Ambrosia artemisiifolia]|uniref:Ubiquitin carboxyl-terminal hydrolase n=1 Tax=Ambrosia artemisiifolia TaxID=4212 RepID=A0AAD5GBU3_AMBAR|nr:hypothetical protein M8C21_015401 [Ambrosia artemisiifolia]
MSSIIPTPCLHLTHFKSHTTSFTNLLNRIQVTPLGRASLQTTKTIHFHCGACGHAPHRLYLCLTCDSTFCDVHAPDHDHDIMVDVDRAELFCCSCGDHVYDQDFDSAVVVLQTAAATLGGRDSLCSPVPESVRKRRRVEYRPWSPDSQARVLLGLQLETNNNNKFPLGLRGLNNLGNTCFMNSVLQALLHTPPLRNYFLSDRHNRFVCQQKKKSNGVNNCDRKRLCLACDTDALFSAVFSGDRKPYSPAKFLYSWWQHAGNLASYEQQDAHEFFISMLDGIHEKVEKDERKPHSQDYLEPGGSSRFPLDYQLDEYRERVMWHKNPLVFRISSGDCCIAHRVFSGILRSDVMCTACGFTSTTYDPCVDISLDLVPNHDIPTKASSKNLHSCNGNAETINPGLSTLLGCLDRFTRPERLGSDQKFFCQQCQVRQESLKQMSIRKLPLVSCFHIKRFEHSPIRKMSRKIDRYMQFPFSLDMSPYLSSSILRSRFGNRIFGFDGDGNGNDPDCSNESTSEFELFAVVTHSGKLDAGHYSTYLRLSNQWYKCDDAWVTKVSENIVRAAQGYMMFYVQKMLYYKASGTS